MALVCGLSCSKSDEAVLLYAKGNEHYMKKELDKAGEFFRKAIEKDGSLINARVMLSKIHYFSSQFKEAKAVLVDVLDDNPSHVGALYWMARILVVGGTKTGGDSEKNEKQAIEYLKRALEIDGHHIQARTLLALVYEKHNMFKESLREYHTALQEEDSLVSARANLSILYQRLGLKERASSEISRAVKIAETAGISSSNLNVIRKEIEGQ
jgi:tetratricopeptide (TPR) repeat protein